MNPVGTYYSSLKEITGKPLFTVMFAWSFFYLLAGLALSILPEYAEILKIDQGEASVLLGVVGVAIGVGLHRCRIYFWRCNSPSTGSNRRFYDGLLFPFAWRGTGATTGPTSLPARAIEPDFAVSIGEWGLAQVSTLFLFKRYYNA